MGLVIQVMISHVFNHIFSLIDFLKKYYLSFVLMPCHYCYFLFVVSSFDFAYLFASIKKYHCFLLDFFSMQFCYLYLLKQTNIIWEFIYSYRYANYLILENFPSLIADHHSKLFHFISYIVNVVEYLLLFAVLNMKYL